MNGKKILENISYRKELVGDKIKLIRQESEISLYDQISIVNETEQLNKNSTIFMTILNKLILKAGDKLEFQLIDKTIKNKIEKESISQILADIDESKFDIQELIKKQSKNGLGKEEKLVLQKYFFMRKFGAKNSSNKELFIEYHGMCSKLDSTLSKHLKLFNINTENSIEIYDDFKSATVNDIDIDNFNDGKDKGKYSIDDLTDIKLSSIEYNKAINNIVKKSIYFKDEESNRALFFKAKNKIEPISKDNKLHFIKSVQSIFAAYGIKLGILKRVRNKGKREYVYSLSVDELIKDIVNIRNG